LSDQLLVLPCLMLKDGQPPPTTPFAIRRSLFAVRYGMSALRLRVFARNNFKEKGKRLKWFEVEVEIKVALVDVSLCAAE